MTNDLRDLRANCIRFDQKNPCADCPFTRNGPPGHTGVLSSLVTYAEMIETGELVHTCHKTDQREDCDGPKRMPGGSHSPDNTVNACAGLMQLFAKSDYPFGPMISYASRQGVDIGDLIKRANSNDDVFGSIGEMMRHYLPEVKKLAGIE